MKVKLKDIIDAIGMMERDSEYFLDMRTGEIEWVSDMAMSMKEKEEICNRLDEDSFCRLPTSFDVRDYDIMENFVCMLSGTARDKLEFAIQGRGAFGRFKDRIRRLGLEQEWYDYQTEEYKKIAVRWCVENDIEYEE